MKNTLIFIVGLIILVLSLILDLLGLERTQDGFGIAQIIGTVVGAILVIYGLIMMGKKKK